MKCLLPAVAIVALVACNDPAPSPESNPVADVPGATTPASTTPVAPGADDAGRPPAGNDNDNDNDSDDGSEGPGGDTGHAIPARFLGEWNTDPAACGSGSNDSRLVVAADAIRFYESSGPVQSASVDGNELTLVARLTGEGETRDATYRYRLSADGRTLTDADSALARQRCE